MNQRNVRSVFLGVGLIGVLLLAPTARGQATRGESTGKTRTYYVAADEVNCDYAPSGRDEVMGHPSARCNQFVVDIHIELTQRTTDNLDLRAEPFAQRLGTS